MLGAIVGDIVGSIYEFNNIKTKDFPLWGKECTFTDDTVMTCAVYKAIKEYKTMSGNLQKLLVNNMQTLGNMYPGRGYGTMFSSWLHSNNPQPYNSFGNGSAMRVSAAGLLGENIEEVTAMATESATVTHNHPEGIKGAVSVAQAIYLAKSGATKEQIKEHLSQYYKLDFTLDDIRSTYYFNETCQQTVPQAIVAFIDANSFEDTIRGAISIGGDSDTLAAIACSIAEPYYGIPSEIKLKALSYLDDNLKYILRNDI